MLVFPCFMGEVAAEREGHSLCPAPAFVLKALNNNWRLFLSLIMALFLL